MKAAKTLQVSEVSTLTKWCSQLLLLQLPESLTVLNAMWTLQPQTAFVPYWGYFVLLAMRLKVHLDKFQEGIQQASSITTRLVTSEYDLPEPEH